MGSLFRRTANKKEKIMSKSTLKILAAGMACLLAVQAKANTTVDMALWGWNV
jgi:hypothetical protein